MSSIKRGDRVFYHWRDEDRTRTGFELDEHDQTVPGYQREDSSDVALVATVIEDDKGTRAHLHVLREHKHQPVVYLRSVPLSDKAKPGCFTVRDTDEDKAREDKARELAALDEATKPEGAKGKGSKG